MQVNRGFEPPSTPGEGVAWDGAFGADGGSAEAGLAGAPDYLVLALRQADAAMRTALTALRYARDEGRHPSGLPVERLAGLAAAMTGGDVRFLSRAIEVLDGMPATWFAFQRGQLSWSQLRGIVLAARPLPVADRGWLDDQLAGAIDQGGEPDRVVDIASDLAERRREQTRPDRDVTDLDANRFVLQPTLDGRRVFGWFDIDSEGGATIAEATDAAADPPSGDEPPVDADGHRMPGTWGPCRPRAAQRAEGLIRIATDFLGHRPDPDGTPRQARPRCTVIVPLDVLTDDLPDPQADFRAGTSPARDQRAADTTGAGDASSRRPPSRLTDRRHRQQMTPRMLWRLAGGRTRLTRTTATRLACDAQHLLLLVDGDDVPVAIGDAHAPITLRHRRAAAAHDQGCRFPGCNAPAAWTDLHHVIPRAHGGQTALANLVSLCRRCHTRVHQRGWTLTLHPDRTLTVTHGRHTFTSRPRLPAPTQPTAATASQNESVTPPDGPANCMTLGRNDDRRSPDRSPADRSPPGPEPPHSPSPGRYARGDPTLLDPLPF